MIKSNQVDTVRDKNRSIESRLYDERSVEETARAFYRERERIREERNNEIRDYNKRWRNWGFNPDMASKLLQDKVQDELINKLPTPLQLPAKIISLAQEKQLQVQALLLGLPSELPSKVDRIPEIELPSLAPFTPPYPDVPDNNASQWRKMMIPENIGKTFTLKWCYEGWSKPTIINHPVTGQTVQLAGDTTLGDVFTSVRSAGGANPLPSNTEIAPFLQGYQFSGIIGRLVRLDGRYTKGWFSDAPTPIERINAIETASENAYFPSGFTRQNYWGAMKVLSRSRFNFPPVAWAEYIRINFRADITVGLESAWDAGWWGVNYPNRLMMQFFQCPFWDVINSEVGLVEPEITNDPVIKIPNGGGFRPKTPPPPKPPNPKCKPMTCCPSQQNELEELKRLIRRLVATVGEPKEVTLWDDDLNKQGQQVKKLKPKDAFEHLKSLTDRIEIALRIIGITDLPLEVDESRSFYPKLGKLYESSKDPAIQKLGKELLKRDRRTITTLFQAMDWYGDAIDEKLGAWESEINFDDIDLVKEGNQNVVLNHANIQDALHDTMKFSFQGGVHSEAVLNLMCKTMGEMAVLKKEIVGQTYKLDLLIDYLGMGYTEKPEQLPICVDFSEKSMKDLSEKKLSGYLTDSEIPISRPILGVKEVNLNTRLTELEGMVSQVAAAHRIPVGSIDVIKEMLKRLSKGDDWRDFIKDMQKFSDENDLQLDVSDITGDKEKTK